MIGREAAITSLKAMSKPLDWEAEDAIRAYTKTLWGENDRGAIILSAGSIELMLERQIKALMPQLNSDERSYLFDFNGPIGTFSGKTRIANALGIISRQIYRKIDLVREMRNACAHSREPITFQTEPIYNAVICLIHDMRIAMPNKDDNADIRNSYLIATILLLAAATGTAPNVAHEMVQEALQRSSQEKPAE